MENLQFKGKISRSRNDLCLLTDNPLIPGLDYLASTQLAFEWANSIDKKVGYDLTAPYISINLR